MSTVMTTSTIRAADANAVDSLELLTSMRHTFQRTEQQLYTELSQTPDKSLNDIRHSFLTAARGATRRLRAWEKKHSPNAEGTTKHSPIAPEPEWWDSRCHAVPGGSIVVRENDWGSVIAFTLRYSTYISGNVTASLMPRFTSSGDYQRELANMSTARMVGPPPAPPSTPAANRPSFFGVGAPESLRRLMSGPSTPQLDPDQDGVVWHEPETYSAVISRKEHPRDIVSLTGIRDVLRQKTSLDSPVQGSSTIMTNGLPDARTATPDSPKSVRARPAVEVSMQAADGRVSGMPEAVEAAGRILHGLEAVSKPPSSSRSSTSDSHGSSHLVETNIRRGKTSSMISMESELSTVGKGSDGSAAAPIPPPKEFEKDRPAVPSKPPTKFGDETPPATESRPGSPSAFAKTLTTSLSSAMRYMLGPADTLKVAPTSPHHRLLMDVQSIDERPHIKYDWTVGKRLRFSCTVYYAKQFDALRRRCGVADIFLKSLARSESWAAEGGKSKSNFLKTTDDRFIIKTLVNAWNVADL